MIQNAAAVLQSAEETLLGGDILIDGAHIAAIGKGICAENAEVIDASGCIVSPGFVNLHTHLYQSMLKGMRDDLPLAPWCDAVTFPFVNALFSGRVNRKETFYGFGMLGALEQLHGGVTTFVDMDMSSMALIEAWKTLGVRGVMAIQTANRWIPKELLHSDEEQLDRIGQFLEKAGTSGTCFASLAPSTPFCCTRDYLLRLSALAEETNARLFIHAAETKRECEDCVRDTGLSPIAYLSEIGFLSERVTLVHGVYASEDEMKRVKESGATLCHCPKSNAKLGSGVAPVCRYLDAGVPVALGTDGAASNDLLDMFEEMRFAALLQRAKHGSDALSAEAAFHMATAAGANALNLDAGVLAAGKRADLFLLDARALGMSPMHDPLKTFVWCGRAQDVKTVFVDGKPVLRDGAAVNVDEAAEQSRITELEERCKEAVFISREPK